MSKSTDNLASVTRIGLDLAKNVFQVHARQDMIRIPQFRADVRAPG